MTHTNESPVFPGRFTTTDLSSSGDLWLRFDWDNDGVFDDDPSARATFGIYSGNPVNIYLQQIYQ